MNLHFFDKRLPQPFFKVSFSIHSLYIFKNSMAITVMLLGCSSIFVDIFCYCPKNSTVDVEIEKFKYLAGVELLGRRCIVEPEVGNNKKARMNPLKADVKCCLKGLASIEFKLRPD